MFWGRVLYFGPLSSILGPCLVVGWSSLRGTGSAGGEVRQPPAGPHRQTAGRGPYRKPVRLKTSRLVMKEFVETPKTTRLQLVADMMSKCNLHGTGCCAWHICLKGLREHVLLLTATDCHRRFRLCDAWQCEMCFALQEEFLFDAEDDPVCGVCRHSCGEQHNVAVSQVEGASSGDADLES